MEQIPPGIIAGINNKGNVVEFKGKEKSYNAWYRQYFKTGYFKPHTIEQDGKRYSVGDWIKDEEFGDVIISHFEWDKEVNSWLGYSGASWYNLHHLSQPSPEDKPEERYDTLGRLIDENDIPITQPSEAEKSKEENGKQVWLIRESNGYPEGMHMYVETETKTLYKGTVHGGCGTGSASFKKKDCTEKDPLGWIKNGVSFVGGDLKKTLKYTEEELQEYADQEVRKALQEQTELRWPTDEQIKQAAIADSTWPEIRSGWKVDPEKQQSFINGIAWLKQQVGNKNKDTEDNEPMYWDTEFNEWRTEASRR